MSREDLVNALRNALSALNLTNHPSDPDIELPELDDAVYVVAQVRRKRTGSPPFVW